MALRCDPATLERLEWPRLVEHLAGLAATERGAAACRGDLFSSTRTGARDRLAETSELRALIDASEAIPFGGVHDLAVRLNAFLEPLFNRVKPARDLLRDVY